MVDRVSGFRRLASLLEPDNRVVIIEPKGRDPQLDRAVREALKLLEQSPSKRAPRPAPIDRASKKP
jgi:hypothetical protein